ncbi:MAG: formylglycine-generating enzyme family protein [SAR324 cluster bacterium]|nr:formylglycine-generating enzyme family protein [SAR324 cluster bacterium]
MPNRMFVSRMLLFSLGTLIFLCGCGGSSGSSASESKDSGIVPASVGMFLIKSAAFPMGDIAGDSGNEDESPSHLVSVSDFYISTHEVTLGEFRNYVPDYHNHLSTGCNLENCPVTNVSWDEAQGYISWLNSSAPLSSGITYRMCTEAEWEYAARAGTSSKWSCGADASCLENVSWFLENSAGRAHQVKQKNANALGLYDMHGNLQEWVEDWYDPDYYATSPIDNPTGPESGTLRSVRGGYFGNDASQVRSSERQGVAQNLHSFFIGIRLCAQ